MLLPIVTFRYIVSCGSKVLHPSTVRSLIQRNVFSRYSSSVPKVAKNLEGPTLDNSEKEYPEHILKIVDQIASLTLLEVADLNDLLAKKLNIKAAAYNMGFVPVQQTAQVNEEEANDADQAPMKSSYSVKLMKYDASKKVALIKEIKNVLPDMNLVQAKKFVESAPGVLKKDLGKEEADAIKKALEACGASVELE